MAGRTAIIWGLVLAAAGSFPAAAQVPPGPPPVPPETGWPRTALQPDYPPPPAAPPRAPADPFVEPPLSPFLPQRPAGPDSFLQDGGRVTLPVSSRQIIRFSPRYDRLPSFTSTPLGEGTTRVIYTGGAIVNVVYLGGPGGTTPQEVEFAADTIVGWVKGVKNFNPAAGIDTAQGGGKKEVELYLAGDVIIRSLGQGGKGGAAVEQVLRADEIYYDVNQSRAVALCADLEMKGVGVPDAVHVRSPEVWRLGKNEWRAFDALTYSSKRPAAPNLVARTKESTLLTQKAVRRNIFGRPYRNTKGEIEEGYERTLLSENATVRLLGVPVFYSYKSETDLAEPFGPLAGIALGNDQIYGFQLFTTWDVHKLLAVRPPNGHRWTLAADYLSLRGPGLGTNYVYSGLDFLGLGGPATGLFKAYGISDHGDDWLGGERGPQPPKPENRGRVQWRHNQELYEAGTTWVRHEFQFEYLTDKNFLEQYYKLEFDQGPNQETFYYLNAGAGHLWGSGWVEANLDRPWVTETEWLPRFDGAVVGQSLLDDWFVYSARASAGYARLRPTTEPPPAVLPTDQRVDAGRFDLYQRLSVPFDAGPVRLTPYGVMDLAYYSQSLTQQQLVGTVPWMGGIAGVPGVDYQTGLGDGIGRFYGGGGVSASTTFSRAYRDAANELFNVRGLNHKVTLGADYFAAYSDVPYTQLPQFDRVFDDALDQGYRNTRPVQSQLIPGPQGVALQTSPLYDPQQLAIRRRVDDHPDTLDSLQVLRLSAQQRLQTKRGFAGREHTVDWMTLDLGASYFPDAERDNYGTSWAFLDYLYLWHVGDRFSISSAGWFDPIMNGARYWNAGFQFYRPDGTNFSLVYRYTDPLNSRALTGSISYRLSSKYAITGTATYDFGLNEALTNTLSLSRTGTDMTMILGFTYNALLSNFGFQFSFIPNAAGASNGRLFQNAGMGGR